MRRAALLLPFALVLAGCSIRETKTVITPTTVTRTTTVTVTTTSTGTTTAKPASAPCAAASLQGSFAGIPGSAGAGQTSYRLTLTNTGATSCWVQGLPQVQLLGTTGAANPTSVSAAPPTPASPPKVSLAHGKSATADARFSPDVPGTGDVNKPGAPCEETSTVLRVTAPGGGTLDAPIQPPTPVCERGSLRFTDFTAAS
ncbi:MAG: DUF4232 domain-containing protein [Gaiellaceae bacterium]